MNHPTDRVEELFLLSQEASACEDYEQAAVFLRKALDLAPLRKDIRAALAKVLAQTDLGSDPGEDRPNTYIPARHSYSPAAEPVRTALRPLPNTAVSTAMRGPTHAAELTPRMTASTSGLRPRVSVRTDGNVNMTVLEDAVSFSDPADEPDFTEEYKRSLLQQMMEDEDEEAQAEAAPAKPRRRRKGKTVAERAESLEDWLAHVFENAFRLTGRIRPATAGYTLCYVAMVAFVVMACVKTHRLFGSQDLRRAAKLAVAANSGSGQPPVKFDASLSVPSLSTGMSNDPPARTEEDILQEGKKQLQNKNFDAAIATLTPALQSGARTASRDLIRETLAQAHDSKGTFQLQQSEMKAAVQSYREAAKLAPTSLAFQLHLSNALYYAANQQKGAVRTGSLQESSKIASDALHQEPQNLNASQLFAQAEQALGHKAEAKGAWQRVLTVSAKGSAMNKRAAEQLAILNKGA